MRKIITFTTKCKAVHMNMYHDTLPAAGILQKTLQNTQARMCTEWKGEGMERHNETSIHRTRNYINKKFVPLQSYYETIHSSYFAPVKIACDQ